MEEKKSVETTKETMKKTSSKFTKGQLLKAEVFKDRKDLVNVLLCEDKEYTIDEVKQLIEKFLKGKVK